MFDVPHKNSFDVALDRQEIRCPECGKLLLKGRFTAGTELRLQCRGTKCKYHKKQFTVNFLTNMNKESQEKTESQKGVSHG